MANNIELYFKKSTDLDVTATVQKFRVYLKFPVLRELNLSAPAESDLLFLKVEVFKEFDFCSRYQTQIVPLMKFNKTMLIKTFDLPTLMATKIRAIFHRKWEKTDKTGKTLITVKGRGCAPGLRRQNNPGKYQAYRYRRPVRRGRVLRHTTGDE